MAPLPSYLKIYESDAIKSIQQGLIKDIEFSDATYQVLVEDIHTHQPCWVFVQLENRKQIKDSICSCENNNEWEPVSACLHVAAAYLAIFKTYSFPLHQRFARSLWNQLCRIYAEQLGSSPSILTHAQQGNYTYQISNEIPVLSIKALTPAAIERLETLISRRPEETEETSIKFSNLSEEEILMWQEGKPSLQLRYDLSYWSDLAKWLIQLQEDGQEYRILFKYSKEQLPCWIQINFNELEIGFCLSETDLLSVIPSLGTVDSPLKVYYDNNEGISCITYDKENGVLHVEAEKIDQPQVKKRSVKRQPIGLDGWTYIPKEGFYAEEPHILLQTPLLKDEELSNALNEYGRFISKFLIDCEINLQPISLSYQLAFDDKWDLHISSYLFKPNDLIQGYSRLIGDWAYIEDKGFYHIEAKRFEEVETIIPIDEMSDFITHNRSWLNAQEGFQTHVRSVEYQLTYTLTSNDRLTFSRALPQTKEIIKQQDFGSWIYLEQYGFFPKSMSSYGFLVRPGISLSAEQIPLFIKMNRDELALIPNFFSSACPITKAGLKIELTDNQLIKVTPEYNILPAYIGRTIKWFDEFVYVEGEGFYEIPPQLRLPEKFRSVVELDGEERDVFLQTEIDQLETYIVSIDPRLIKIKHPTLIAQAVQAAAEKGKGWYRLALYYEGDHGLIPVTDIWKSIKKKKQAFSFFQAGVIDIREERFNWIRQLKKERLESNQFILLTALEFMRLNAFDPIELRASDRSIDLATSQELLNDLVCFKTPEKPDIGGLVSHLRPYQTIGVEWLWFLYHQQLSGLLCDDMGLGKTHQAMALLISVYNYYQSYAEGEKRRFLIVCPTSVIYHWQEKLQQFSPHLKVYTFYSAGRSIEEFHNDYDVLLTSYGILRNEREILSKVKFEVAIFDEIQIAKNQSSRIYSSLTKIQSQMKIGLTGTPIENYLRELKSLLDIVLPSYMPGDSHFRELFVKPIEKEGNLHRKDLLNRLVKPFILRRKKEDVLPDLPEKIEEIAHCDLSLYQHQLYTEVLLERRRHLLEDLENEGSTIPYLHIFALLSSLKQICDHPAVYLKKAGEYKDFQSGKWELFCELLREARESHQKVVVFSQYLGMLDIFEDYLTSQDIGFATIRGSTQNRKEQIIKFNHDPTCEVFIGSLQAAGLGVDLTAGSVVIHYDRWWNAARENQATDRVHRIGQTRGVQVFKLVTKNTFEEKIDEMIIRKGRLMEDVIGVDDHNIIKKFSREEMIDLLNLVETGIDHGAVSDDE